MQDTSESAGRPQVLVLMATRNGVPWLAEQLDSVLSQRDVDVRLLVRDDGSTDQTPQRLLEFAAREPRMTVMPDRTATGSAAGNFFALMASCDVGTCQFIALADQDDEWLPDKLSRAVQALRSSGAAGYSASVRASWPDGRTHDLIQTPQTRWADFLFEGAGQGCSFVLDATFFRQVQSTLRANRAAFSQLHYHDWALYALCRSSGLRWHFDPKVCLNYRQHASNDTGARASGAGLRRRVALIREGWYRRQVDAVACLVQTVRPGDPATARWQAIRIKDQGSNWSHRASRLWFVIRHGRRRLQDRAILATAVLCGYL
jgi:rhamnosyltransferase